MDKLLYLKDEKIKDFIEKLFYAYRETYSDPKKILDKYSVGLAHLKALNLISTYQGLTISELISKLKITKQSLNRVLQELHKNNFIIYKKGQKDSRHKHVYLSSDGKTLTNEIFCEQKKRIYKALKNSNSEAVLNFNEVIEKIING
jgi:DNA-binding MarR family transcriptional regulator|tara:strand:- start:3238 stop:3675 length:438 start_codon:yes stop_codon:yes gene_type:complete